MDVLCDIENVPNHATGYKRTLASYAGSWQLLKAAQTEHAVLKCIDGTKRLHTCVTEDADLRKPVLRVVRFLGQMMRV